MSSSVTLKAKGLKLQGNQLELEPGALNVASNVIIRRDDVIEQRRGYKLFGTQMGTSTDRAKQLVTYKERILRHYSNKLEFENGITNSDGEAEFSQFNGTYLEPETGRRIRAIEGNGNFYFTTSQGIKKISARTASQLSTSSGYITQAGGVKALDLQGTYNVSLGSQTGFMPVDSAVAYRVVWGITDANNNLILGTPSQRLEIYAPMLNITLEDFNRVLGALDNVSNAGSSLISDGNYVSTLGLLSTDSANQLQTNLLSLATKLDTDILYANDTGSGVPLTISSAAISGGNCTITFSSGDPTNYVVSGSNILLAGFAVSGSGSINGPQIVSSVTSSTIVFPTAATGTITVTGSTINSYAYGIITPPGIPSTPATHSQLADLQDYLNVIITKLQTEPSAVISSGSQTAFITPLAVTTTVTTELTITIPEEVTTSHFYQIYRSDIASATGTQVLSEDVFPSDELKLVYEAFPTTAEIAAGIVQVNDITPDAFRGANLYTNETTGEGILQSNDVPPFALDINYFKNCAFFANTRTRYRQVINLLGVTNMVTDFTNNIIPKLTITDGTTTNTYSFTLGLAEITTVKCKAASTLVQTAAPASYFTINSANDTTGYYVWYKCGSSIDPAVANKTGIEVFVGTGDTAITVAQKTSDKLNVLNSVFETNSSGTDTVTVINLDVGYTTNAAVGTSGFTIIVTQQGEGESAATKEVLLSDLASVAQAVDATARSLVHVINTNDSEIVYAYYISGAQDVPGQILLEKRSLDTTPFYVLGNNDVTGSSFNPDISPSLTITNISVANPTVITTSSPHGLTNQDMVVISGSDSTPLVDGLYEITYISTTQFSIPVTVTVGGTKGGAILATDSTEADNEQQKHRIYYSKFLQPEAVPALNYIDVGAQDKAILRIFPLKDSLFVYKEDGLFRISGETAPFNLALFDSSCILIAPDSISVSQNIIYGWTTQGIIGTSESGVGLISRDIDTEILKLATSQYTNFPTATWGIGYESDNSYTVYTVTETTDTRATIAYRYSTLTATWTTFDKTSTCGVINSVNDRQYLGAGDTNFLEQERKDFTRYDYADRQYDNTLIAGSISGNVLHFSDVGKFAPGDVVVQDQTLTIQQFNNVLATLDNDTYLSPHNYVSTLQASTGANMRTSLDALLNKVANDAGRLAVPGATIAADYTQYESIAGTSAITAISATDPTIITTSTPHGLQSGRIVLLAGTDSVPAINDSYEVTVIDATHFSIPIAITVPGTTGTVTVQNDDFDDIKASYNGLVRTLNSDVGIQLSNYMLITEDTIQEAIVESVTSASKHVRISLTLELITGPIILYKGIESSIVWAPQTFNDPLSLKQIREATIMFENKQFTEATLSFATDLLPQFIDVHFTGYGPGNFGFNNFGSNFFGGTANSSPFRTTVPRNSQRCRYIAPKFSHYGAREKYSIFGITLTGETTSVKAYR